MKQFFAISLFVLLAASATSCAQAQHEADSVPKTQTEASFAVDELIIKLKPDLGIDSVKELMDRYKVVDAAPVFMNAQDAEAIKAKFPERAKRAPKDVEVPDLSGVYKLTLPKGSDVNAAVAAFSRDPNVEYAQPNYIATTQEVS